MPSLLHRFYADAMSAGIRPIHLVAGSVICPAGTWEDHVLSSPDGVTALLDAGENVGFLLTGKDGTHPNQPGIWGLVVETPEAMEMFGGDPFSIKFAWGDPHRCILVGRLPAPLSPRKSRLVRASHTVKLTGILPAPGSVHPDGGVIQVFVRTPETRLWEPWNGDTIDWNAISILDPDRYTPSSLHLVPLDKERAEEASTRVPAEWIFWQEDVPPEWNRHNYTSAKGDFGSRKIRGDGYIRNRLKSHIVSRSGEGGRKTLLTIAVHLVQYLRLPDETVLTMLAEPVYGAEVAWNDRCLDPKTGSPAPWDLEDLRTAIAAAHEYIPAYGVLEYQRFKALREGMERLQAFRKILHRLPEPTEDASSMKASDLYEVFLELFSVDRKDITYRRFTLAIQTGIKVGFLKLRTKLRTKKKLTYYQGVSREILDSAMDAPEVAEDLADAA